jgi:hypothetical protein
MTSTPTSPIVATVTVNNESITVEQHEYATAHPDGRPRTALLAFVAETGEFYGDISVNLPQFPIGDGQFFVEADTLCSDAFSELLAAEIIHPTGRQVRYGTFGSNAYVYALTTK